MREKRLKDFCFFRTNLVIETLIQLEESRKREYNNLQSLVPPKLNQRDFTEKRYDTK